MPAVAVLAIAGAAIVGAILAQVIASRPARNTISGAIAHASVWVSYASTQVLAPLARPFMQALVGALEATSTVVGSIIAQVVTHITGRPPPAGLAEGQPSQESLLAFGEALGADLGPTLTAVVAPAAGLDPDAAPERLNRIMGVSAGFALEDWWAHSLVELSSLGLLSAVADVSGAIAQGFGISTMGRQAMRLLLRNTLADPVATWANRTYTPTGLTTAEIIEGWQQGFLDDSQVTALLRDKGYTYDLGILLLNLRQRDFTLEQAEQLWRLGQVDDGTLDRIVRRQGYGVDRAALVGTLVRSKKALALLEETADQARALYRVGQLDEPELRQLLTEAGYRSEEIDLVLVREELARREARLLSKAELLAAYTDGILDDAATRGALRAQRYDDATIDVLLALQRRHLTPAEVLTAYLGGRLDRQEALRRLVARGYSEDEAALLLDLRTRTLSEGQVVDALRRGLLTPAGAFEQLRRMGFSAEAADLIVALGSTQITAGDVQAALLRGLIDPEEARARLTALGYRPADVELLLALRFRLLTRGQVLDAFNAGRIDSTDARLRLLELGFEAPDADLLLQVFGKVPKP